MHSHRLGKENGDRDRFEIRKKYRESFSVAEFSCVGSATSRARMKNRTGTFSLSVHACDAIGRGQVRLRVAGGLGEGMNALRATCAEARVPHLLSRCNRVSRRRALFEGPLTTVTMDRVAQPS